MTPYVKIRNAHPTLRFQDVARGKTARGRHLFENVGIHYTYGARGAIYQFLRSLLGDKGNFVLLPAFHCPTVVDPVVRAGYKVLFYGIHRDFSIDYDDLVQKLSPDVAVVLVINFCGFPADIDRVLELREKYDYYLLDDWAHSFLRGESEKLTGDRADAAVFSFYKIVPSYMGGGLRINTPYIPFPPVGKTIGAGHSVVVLKRLAEQVVDNAEGGAIKRVLQSIERARLSLKGENHPSQNDAAPKMEEVYPFHEELASARMPWFARAILERGNLDEIVSLRRRNYLLVDRHLRENEHIQKVFRALPKDVCPWGYPVLLRERSRSDRVLRERGVPLFTFGEMLHPLVSQAERSAREDAEYLSGHLLLLAVHQNLRSEDVLGYCRTINEFFSTSG